MNYPVPAELTSCELEIKKSRFIAYAGHAPDRETAMALLEQLKSQYPDARHHCWAYLIGNPQTPDSVAMNDDGEPGGTAGKPILNVLQHKGIGDVMLVVVRYFGGIKLGAGGLVRAYSGAAQEVMTQLPRLQHVALTPLRLSCDFRHEQFVRHFVDEHQGKVSDVDYTQRVIMSVALPADNVSLLEQTIGGLDIHLLSAEETKHARDA